MWRRDGRGGGNIAAKLYNGSLLMWDYHKLLEKVGFQKLVMKSGRGSQVRGQIERGRGEGGGTYNPRVWGLERERWGGGEK